MILESKKRAVLMKRLYRRSLLRPYQVYRLINSSVKRKKGFSVIRLGDVMAKLLSKKDLTTLKEVAPFLGIPYPPTLKLLRDLDRSVRLADVVGVTYFPNRARQLQGYMRVKQWTPKMVTDSFINDLMYEQGYLHRLIQNHRIALVGRSARAAASQLRKRNLPVSVAVDLPDYHHLSRTFAKLRRTRDRWDVALVGASVPGRILCVSLTKRLNKTTFEIGHMMDALADPREWRRHHDRKRFKLQWMRKLARKKSSTY